MIAAVGMASVVAAGVILYLVVVPPTSDGDRLPPPPDDARQTLAIREHLRETYDLARREPASVGSYCQALHSDMFYASAEQCYAVLLEGDPDAWPWTYARALLRSDLGGGEALTRELMAIVESKPDFAPAWLRLGDAHFKTGRYDEAHAAWSKVRELPEPAREAVGPVAHHTEMPAAAYAALGLARISMLRGDRVSARQTLEDLVASSPSFGSAHRLLAEVYTAEGRPADAARALARARRLPPFASYADPMVDPLARQSRNSTFLLRLASEANLSVNGAWSEYLTRRALEFDPDSPEVVIKMARVLRTVGRSAEALPYFERYQRLVPGDQQVVADIGSCLSDLGRFGEAEPYLRRAAASLDDALTHYNLALLLARTDRVPEAIVEYRRALDRNPNDPAARLNLAAALVRVGDLATAEQELFRILAADPEDALAHANLGIVLAQRGELGRARRALREALRINPSLTQAAEALAALGGA